MAENYHCGRQVVNAIKQMQNTRLEHEVVVNLPIEKLRQHLWPLFFLLAATAAVYGRIIGHEFILNWDDGFYVANNAAVQGFSIKNIRAVFSSYYCGNYAPVQMLSYMLDYELWGLWPGGFLLTNLLLHSLNGVLVYRLFFRFHGDQLLATVGAAFFLLHPVQVESVAWLSQRKNLLAMLFFLVAWECYARYRERVAGKGRREYLASLVAFILALLAKSVAVIFPLVILLFDVCFPIPGRTLRLRDKLPYILAAGAVAALALHSQLPEGNGWGGYSKGYHGGSPLATLYTMLPVFCRYLQMLVWPTELSAAYAPVIYNSFEFAVALSAILLVGVALLCVRLFRYERSFGFWAIFFFIGFLPVSQIIPLVTLMNDRYYYFPMIGAAALVGGGAAFLLRKVGAQYATHLYVVIFVMMFGLALLSCQRAAVWHDARTLWSDAAKKSPNHFMVWEALGEAYHFSKPMMVTEAMHAYRRALELDPQNEFSLYNSGVLYENVGDFDKAHEMLNKLLDNNPDHVMGLASRGDIFLKQKNYEAAEKAYKRAYQLQPESVEVVHSLGDLALLQKRFELAREYFLQLEAKRPKDPEIPYKLACVEAQSDHNTEALLWLEKALQRGYRDYSAIHDGKELEALWNEPRFNMLLDQYFPEETNGS